MRSVDLAEVGVRPGATAEISSPSGCTLAVTAAHHTLRRGVVSLTHGFGAGGQDDPQLHGTSPNELLSCSTEYDAITGMPRMGAVRVWLHSADEVPAGGTNSLPPSLDP